MKRIDKLLKDYKELIIKNKGKINKQKAELKYLKDNKREVDLEI